VARREEGFTLVELVVVLVIVAILMAIAIGFHQQARAQASDATAKSNLRVAVPAIESYRADNGTYAGMTLANLQGMYSPGIQGIEVLSAAANDYCVRSVVGSSTWFTQGPSGAITTTACA
jgi:prepilin-type N-terminal cleavage/methylation domain-containing protein